MTLPELFEPSLRDRAVVGALAWDGRTFTFGDLDRRSNRVARLLLARGVQAGDRLGAQLASFKIPRAFVRVESLPRTALGKVRRHLLPAWTR